MAPDQRDPLGLLPLEKLAYPVPATLLRDTYVFGEERAIVVHPSVCPLTHHTLHSADSPRIFWHLVAWPLQRISSDRVPANQQPGFIEKHVPPQPPSQQLPFNRA